MRAAQPAKISMPMLVKFYQSLPENPFHPENPDSDKLELKCVTSVIYIYRYLQNFKTRLEINFQSFRLKFLCSKNPFF